MAYTITQLLAWHAKSQNEMTHIDHMKFSNFLYTECTSSTSMVAKDPVLVVKLQLESTFSKAILSNAHSRHITMSSKKVKKKCNSRTLGQFLPQSRLQYIGIKWKRFLLLRQWSKKASYRILLSSEEKNHKILTLAFDVIVEPIKVKQKFSIALFCPFSALCEMYS